ncbi:MAG: hypothetical protein ACRDO7_14465 [Nocardioidaceae bacterium]
MPSRATGALFWVLGSLLLTGCASDADEPSYDPTTDASDTADGFEPPPGRVTFDFRAGRHAGDAAVDAYVAWQRAATRSIRDRELSDAVQDGATDAPVRTVEQSLATVSEGDYTVPRTMIGRLESAHSTPRAAILGVCLWSSSFDYHERASGRTVADDAPHWMGVEVRMTRESGHHSDWNVSGMIAGEDCKGSRP